MEKQEKQKPKSAFYESAFKLVADFEAAKNDNGNIDDFKKYPMYRALRYKSENHEAIAKLCSNANLENIAESNNLKWLTIKFNTNIWTMIRSIKRSKSMMLQAS